MTIGIAKRMLANPDNIGGANPNSPNALTNNLPITVWERYNMSASNWGSYNQPAVSTVGSISEIAPTSTDYVYGQAQIASATTIAGVGSASAGTTLGLFQRFQCRIKQVTQASTRYWIGMFGQTLLLTTNQAQIKTATPAFQLIGFRMQAGLEGTWKAIVAQPGGSPQAIIDTGFSFDNTHGHTFGIFLVNGSAQFYIDFALKATISITGLNLGTLMTHVCALDNLGTTNAVQFGHLYGIVLGQ